MQSYSTIALTSILVVVSLPQPAEAQVAIPAPVAVCYTNPACIVGSVIIGGITYFTVTQGGQTQQFPVEGEYLEDPEGDTEDWTDYVPARDAAAAQRTCADYARRAYAVLRGVRHVRGQTYECQFRSYRS